MAHSVAELQAENVSIELECIDRMYLNCYVPQLTSAGGVAAYFRHYNYDNVRLTAEPAAGGVPDIVDIAVDGSGNVILSLDGPAAGLTVEGSDDLTVGSFQDRNTAAPSGNTFTIPAADVVPNGDGKDFFLVRN